MLMSMSDQQQAAKVFVGAFLESTLQGKTEYNSLFENFNHGSDWLPPTLYTIDFANAGIDILSDFDDDFNLSTASVPGVSFSAKGFDQWTEDALPDKYGSSSSNNRMLTLTWSSNKYDDKQNDNNGMWLGAWQESQFPVFKVDFDNSLCPIEIGDTLYVSLCSGNTGKDEENISFQIQLTDRQGNTVSLPIDAFGGVPNPLQSSVYKPPFSLLVEASEPVLQAIGIQTDQFEGLSGDIVSMEWIFNENKNSISHKKVEQKLFIGDLRLAKEQ